MHVDKRFKIGKPTGIELNSTDTRPIKATRTALNIIKAKQKATENSETGKVTAVVAVRRFLVIKLSIHGTLSPEKRKLSPKTWLNLKKKDLY